MIKSISKNALILSSFALVSTGLLAVTHALTKDRIEMQKKADLIQLLSDVLPQSYYDNQPYQDCVYVINEQFLGNQEKHAVYRARKQGKVSALVIETTAPNGYSGAIDLVVGVDLQGKITGSRVLTHKETPGLGDKIELRKSNWILEFNDQVVEGDKDKRWAVKKDGGMFDQFTGATITPRAVTKAVKDAALYASFHQESLLSANSQCGEKS
ncbi:electron transport complex subunit RsxG [Algicola sagamiensis]|uniref:electron transport complex subunit RsxG n=1 Tax=Algicola sagamiensis TaxID=163869 RepID=UPI00036F59A0|nr:electron transport complex subunit RsxG [Algicola sagamiensis]